jgi:hypothetical protein
MKADMLALRLRRWPRDAVCALLRHSAAEVFDDPAVMETTFLLPPKPPGDLAKSARPPPARRSNVQCFIRSSQSAECQSNNRAIPRGRQGVEVESLLSCKETGIDPPLLSKFMAGERQGLSMEALNRVAAVLKLKVVSNQKGE